MLSRPTLSLLRPVSTSVHPKTFHAPSQTCRKYGQLTRPSTANPGPDHELAAELERLPLLQAELARLSSSASRRTPTTSLSSSQAWIERRLHSSRAWSAEQREAHLTAGALSGPGKLAIEPLMRIRDDGKEAELWAHVGKRLNGHPGVVHGGLIATLCDEACGHTAVANMGERVVTANLSIDFRAPMLADQFIVIRTLLSELKGRKAVVTGTVEGMNGTVLADVKSVFVRPRQDAPPPPVTPKRTPGAPAGRA